MCHIHADDLEYREAELRRQAAELLKKADALREMREAEGTARMRQRPKEAALV